MPPSSIAKTIIIIPTLTLVAFIISTITLFQPHSNNNHYHQSPTPSVIAKQQRSKTIKNIENNPVDKESSSQRHHDDIVPTLLRIVDPSTGQYLNALNHSLYNDLKRYTMLSTEVYDGYNTKMSSSSSSHLLRSSSHWTDHHGSTTTIPWESFGMETSIASLIDRSTIVNRLPSLSSNVLPPQSYPRDNSNNLSRPSSSSLNPTIHLLSTDKTTLTSFHSPLTLTLQSSSSSSINDDDIMTLHCPSSSSSYVEAFTVGHMTTTVSKQNSRHLKIDSFPIIRHSSCLFRLWTATTDDDTLHLVATSNTIHFPHAMTQPTFRHLSLPLSSSESSSSSSSSLGIHFGTGGNGTPLVSYRPLGRESWTTVTAAPSESSRTYTSRDLCAAPANLTEVGRFIDPGWFHSLSLTNLTPGQIYEYYVGLEDGIPSSIERFAAPSFDAEKITFLAYGDQGCEDSDYSKWWNGYIETTDRVTTEITTGRRRIDMVHHVGDLSYANGVGHAWDSWGRLVEGFTKSVPLVVTVGNHEYDYMVEGGGGVKKGYHPSWGNYYNDSGGECGIPFVKRFGTTAPASEKSNGVYWYSYNYGPVHFVVLSSEHDLSKTSRQRDFLRFDLASVDEEETPWIIIEIHRPLYHPSAMPRGNDVVSHHLRDSLEDLFHNYNVDLVIAGHYHSYHRSCPTLYRGVCRLDRGTMHATVGSAGAVLDEGGIIEDVGYTEMYLKVWGYGRVTVDETSLFWEFVEDETGDVLDRVVLDKVV